MAKIHFVIVIYSVILKRQGVVVTLSVLFPDVVGRVMNLLTFAHPTDSLFVEAGFREYGGLQPFAEQRLFFYQIDYFKLQECVLGDASHSEEKPLVVPLRVYIVLQNQFVRMLAHLICLVEITRLED